MESLQLALSVVVPMLVYMAVGAIIRKCRILSLENFRAMNHMLFKVFIPFSLFFSVYSVDLKEVIVPDIFAFTALAVIGAAIASWYLIGLIFRDRKDRVTITQAIYRSNFVLFGGMIAESLCDNKGVALFSSLAAVIIPLYNIIAVVLFEMVRGGKINWKNLIINIFKNTLVLAGIIGIVFSLAGWKLPALLETPLRTLSKCATPMALVALGGILSIGSIRSHIRELSVTVISKLVILPAIALTLGILLGFRGSELAAVMAVFASPTAVASAPMAQSMGGNGDLASEAVAFTSVCCIVTLFVFVWGLSGMGMI